MKRASSFDQNLKRQRLLPTVDEDIIDSDLELLSDLEVATIVDSDDCDTEVATETYTYYDTDLEIETGTDLETCAEDNSVVNVERERRWVPLPLLAETNAHEKDAYIDLQEEGHVYTIRGSKQGIISVTTLIGQFFPTYDARKTVQFVKRRSNKQYWENPSYKYYRKSTEEIIAMWAKIRDDACQAGAFHHKQIEQYYNGQVVHVSHSAAEIRAMWKSRHSTEELARQRKLRSRRSRTHSNRQRRRHGAATNKKRKMLTETEYILQQHQRGLASEKRELRELFRPFALKINAAKFEPYRTEWSIYDESLSVAGTVDILYRNKETCNFVLIDWKFVKKLVKRKCRQQAFAPLQHLDNTNFAKYALQLSMYRYILETQYGIVVEDQFIVLLHAKQDSFRVEHVPYLKRDIQNLLKLRRENLQ